MTASLSFFRKTLSSAVLGVSLMAATLAAQAETLRMGMVTPPSHIWNQVSERFDNNLQQETAKDMKIKIFPLSKLGGEQQMIDLLQSGGMQLAVLTAGVLSNREPSISGWFLPGLFDDVRDAADAAHKPQAQAMLQKLEAHKLVGLGYTFAGMRHVLSTKPMDSVDDFANKKIRSFPNQVFNDFWQELGAAPTAMPISEVSQSLTTNLLDAVDVDLDIVVGMKMYQQAPNLTLTNHMAFPGIVVASKTWWDGLSDAQRAQVKKAFAEAESWGFEKQAEAEVSNLDVLKKAGVTIVPFDKVSLQPVMNKINGRYMSENADIKAFYEENR
ncbi:TRAP transporter substrate-binding protein [Parathalassolituus penaei]|uniref:TRAP transporter substrate-binding protein n=1 Tax=Parathalassolituus penaei TaxID=2997323 RepID=A0A9X3EH76_9GAMM|nr:TRAP transporter substrate-binding protein [Parathalassolituus penaei]MCY0967457.1 TRAP transporter substrate-binding protein [Parathalassolituus penaei]